MRYHLIISKPIDMVLEVICDWFELLKLCDIFTDLGCDVAVHYNYSRDFNKK